LEREAAENYKRYSGRINLFKKFSYDVEKERNFIIEEAQPLYGDILEVGTGKGYLTVALAKEGYTFTGIDILEEEQNLARQNVKYFGFEKQVDFKIENAEHLSFENESFDIIFSVNMMHHLMNPLKVIDELIRIVSFEGKIILSDFSKEGLEVANKVHQHEGRVHQCGDVDLDNIMRYLQGKGFNIDRHNGRYQEIGIAYHRLI